jgi:anti-sigma B factor antagonist
MELDVSIDRGPTACIATVKGEVDVYTSPLLKRRLVDAADGECTTLIVVLDGVGFIDSSGLGVLVGALRRMKERDGDLRIVCTREPVLKILRITGLDRVFPVFSSLDEARES